MALSMVKTLGSCVEIDGDEESIISSTQKVVVEPPRPFLKNVGFFQIVIECNPREIPIRGGLVDGYKCTIRYDPKDKRFYSSTTKKSISIYEKDEQLIRWVAISLVLSYTNNQVPVKGVKQ